MRTVSTVQVSGTSSAGRERAGAVTLHVVHVTVVAGIKPFFEITLVFAQVDTGYADLLKAKFSSPGVHRAL